MRKLAQDYKIDCDVGDYPRLYAPYAYLMILVYPVGVPALYFLLLKQVQSHVFPDTGDELRDVRLRTTVFADKIEHVKFLFRSYEPRCWWWEIFETARKLSLTGMVIFYAPGTASQILIGMLICLFSIYMYTT